MSGLRRKKMNGGVVVEREKDRGKRWELGGTMGGGKIELILTLLIFKVY